LKYVHARQQEALQFIGEHPGRFLCWRAAGGVFLGGNAEIVEYEVLAIGRNLLFLLSSVLAFWDCGW